MTEHRQGLPTLLALALGLLCAFACESPAAIIDDFSTPQGPLTGVPDVVSGPGIIGDFREASDQYFSVSGGGAFFSFPNFPGGTNVMAIAYDGTAAPSDVGAFAPLVDLTDGGFASQFLLGISEISGGIFVLIDVTDADGANPSIMFREINLPGLYAQPIPTDLADFTRVRRVDVVFFLSPFPASVEVDFLCTGTQEACIGMPPIEAVPEPSTAVLFALGGICLALLTRKKTRHRA